MEPIIAPVSVEILKSELTPSKKLRDTNKSHNEIYVITHHDSPNVMKEIGRLREEAFRDSGGGSGLSMDIDEFDTMETPYQQLIVWDPDAEKILGGYRFIYGNDIKLGPDGQPLLATAHMFHFSDKFIKEYLPYTIELGRSFVAPEYQSSKAGAKALFALDNLWDGLGALGIVRPDMKYFFGKMTMYPDYNREARDLIQHFLFKHFKDEDNLVTPLDPLVIETPKEYLESVLCEDEFNHEFSEAEETCILINFDEIHEAKVERHINSFIREKIANIKARFPKWAESMGENLSVILAGKRAQRQQKIAERQKKKQTRKTTRKSKKTK